MTPDFLYLFIWDLCHQLNPQQSYELFCKKEPGYSSCWLQAYLSAFKSPEKGITEALLKNIHRDAMSFNKTKLPGQYRATLPPMSYRITPLIPNPEPGSSPIRVLHYNASEEGVTEFLEYWLKKPSPTHTFCFEEAAGGNRIYLYSANNIFYSWQETLQPQILAEEDFKRKLSSELKNSIYNGLYIGNIDCLRAYAPQKIAVMFESYLRKIIHEYELDIQKSKTNDDKIYAIAAHVRHISQLHPFNDGNVRTCYILINKLLREHDLSLTILMNPNRLECCSLQEIINNIKQGQKHFQQLLAHPGGPITLSSPLEPLELFQRLQLTPRTLAKDVSPSLTQEFINLLRGVPIISSRSAPMIPPSVFPEGATLITPEGEIINRFLEKLKNITVGNKKYEPLFTTLSKNEYEKAFRQACADAPKSIIDVFLKFQPLLGFNVHEVPPSGQSANFRLSSNKMISDLERAAIRSVMGIDIVNPSNLVPCSRPGCRNLANQNSASAASTLCEQCMAKPPLSRSE
jgi:prophage maintenance system killer protein